MRRLGRFTAMMLLAMAPRMGSAQDALNVSAADLMSHVEKRAPLVYPPIAKAARVSGTVVVQIEVNGDGTVAGTKVISGPPMLLQASLDSVKPWTFKPFDKDGAKVTASGPVSLVFTLGDSETGNGPASEAPEDAKTVTVVVQAENAPVDDAEKEVAQRYFAAWNDCTRGMLATKRDQNTVAACRKAADTATEFAPDRRFIEKRSSNVYAATALANTGDFVGALRYANRAVDVVKLGHDDNSGSNAAYSTRGTIEAMLNNWSAADADLTIAEEFERKAIAWAEKEKNSSLVQNYRHVLARDLRVHARVLEQLNRSKEAQAKLDEAAKL